MAENSVSSPPPVLACARVLHYVMIDSDIKFSGQSRLFVDGKELGAVPCLAICEEKKTGGVLLFHCTGNWTVLGCTAHKSVTDAQIRAEGIYKGASSRWIDANVTPEAAEAYLNGVFANHRCSICGGRPDESVDFSLVRKGSALICNLCAK